jgi:hypothetical protein
MSEERDLTAELIEAHRVIGLLVEASGGSVLLSDRMLVEADYRGKALEMSRQVDPPGFRLKVVSAVGGEGL